MLRELVKQLSGKAMEIFLFPEIIPHGSCVVLMFHRVLPAVKPHNLDRNLIMPVENFVRIIETINKFFKIVDLYEWAINPTDERVCALTFDDGWADNYEHAFPILKNYNIPATIFLSVKMVDTSRQFWFEKLSLIISQNKLNEIRLFFREYFLIPNNSTDKNTLLSTIQNELKKLTAKRIDIILKLADERFVTKPWRSRSVLNWKEIEEMSHNRVSFGSHGLNHSILTMLTGAEKREEICQSKTVLENKPIKFVPMISFPNGNFDQSVLDISKECGYKVMIASGRNTPSKRTDHFLVNRISVNAQISPTVLLFNVYKEMKRKRLLLANLIRDRG